MSRCFLCGLRNHVAGSVYCSECLEQMDTPYQILDGYAGQSYVYLAHKAWNEQDTDAVMYWLEKATDFESAKQLIALKIAVEGGRVTG